MQDRRRDYTRAEIARAAVGLFVERGYDDVTVDEIAAAAGISARTFFRYFASRDDVLLAEHHRLQQRLVRALLARPAAEGAVTALRNAFIETSTVSPADRARLLRYGRVLTGSVSITERMLGVQAQASVEVVALVAERMGVDPGADLRPRVIVTAMTAVAAGGFRDWVEGGGRGSPSSPIGDGLALLELGLASCDERPRGRGVNRR